MKVRRKSLWRSTNNKRAKFNANRRAAKERIRIERSLRKEIEIQSARAAHLTFNTKIKPLFIVSVRCLDGEGVTLRIFETPNGLSVSPTKAGKKIAAILANYRPVSMRKK